jgi:transposase
MLIIPGLSESLGAVGKRIIRTQTTDTSLSVETESLIRCATCPSCSFSSSRVHGQYQRTVRSQPWMGRSVYLIVQVRRFAC